MSTQSSWFAWLILGGLASVPYAASSQDQPTPATLDTVVVIGTRSPDDALLVPAAIDRIDAQDIARAQPRINLSESLQRVPGVVARDRQNHAQDLQVSIRGFGARATFGVRGVRLYTDGIPATMPDGQGQVSHFMLDSAERIEVLRGPFSALYGNASGGVIELFTADAPVVPQLQGGLIVGSDDLRRTSLSWHAPWGADGNDSFLVDLAQVDTDGYREHSAAQRRNGQLLVKGGFGNAGRYTILANTLDLQADDPQGLTAEQLQGDRRAASQGALTFDTRKTVRQQQLGARVETNLLQHHAITATAWGGKRDTFQMLSVPVAPQQDSPLQGGGVIDLGRAYHGIDVRWRWSTTLHGRPFSLTTGIDYEVSAEQRRGYENFVGETLGVVGALRRDERNRVTGQDAYLQADWQPSDRWRINVGARHSQVRFRSRDRYITIDNPDDSGGLAYSRTSPVAGVLFRATPWLSLYGNAGSGFETPTFAELAYRDDGLSGLNDTLLPARSRNHEVGLRARRDGWSGSAAAFLSRTRDELVVVANEDGRSVYDNAGISRRRGIELTLSGQVATGWHVATAYTFLDARYLRDFAVCAAPPCRDDEVLIQAGRHIPGLSRHVAWAELRWTPADEVDFVLQGQHVGRVFVDDANTESAPAYAKFDLAVERRFAFAGLQWRGFVRVDNVLGRRIIGSVIVNAGNGRYYEPAPGRNWTLGLMATRTFD